MCHTPTSWQSLDDSVPWSTLLSACKVLLCLFSYLAKAYSSWDPALIFSFAKISIQPLVKKIKIAFSDILPLIFINTSIIALNTLHIHMYTTYTIYIWLWFLFYVLVFLESPHLIDFNAYLSFGGCSVST